MTTLTKINNINTSTSSNKKTEHILKDINDFEYNIIIEDSNKNHKNIKEYIKESNPEIYNLISNTDINYTDKIINDFVNRIYGFNTVYNFIIEKIIRNESFLIYGDYDSDGINSTINMYITLNIIKKYYKSKSVIKIKNGNRLEGYGINKTIIENNIDFFKLYDNMITVDFGCSIDFSLIKDDINIIVFDHHLPEIKNMSENILYVSPIFYERQNEIKTVKKYIGINAKNNVNKYYNTPKKKEKIKKIYQKDIIDKLNSDNIKYINNLGGAYISAGLLTGFFGIFVINQGNQENIENDLSDSLERIKNFFLITGTITTITDVMPLKKFINFAVLRKGCNIYNQFIKSNNTDFIETKNKDNTIINVINNYMKVLGKFTDKDNNKIEFNIRNLGFKFGPYFNSFGRIIIPEYLIYKIINGEKDDAYNIIRKNEQNIFESKIKENLDKYNSNKVNIVDIKDLIPKTRKDQNLFTDNNYETLIKTLMVFMNNKYQNYFDNFYTEENSKIDKELLKSLEDEFNIIPYIKENKIVFTEGIVGLIANKVNIGYVGIAGIGEEDSDGRTIIKSSGRSKVDFIDIQEELKNEKIIAYFGGHNKAFGIGVYKDKIEDFQQYIDNKNIIPNIKIDLLYDVNFYKQLYNNKETYEDNIKKYKDGLIYLNNNGLLNVYNTYIYGKIDKNSIIKIGKNKEHLKFFLPTINSEVIVFFPSNIKKIEEKLKTYNNILFKVNSFKKNTFYKNRELYEIITNENEIFFK